MTFALFAEQLLNGVQLGVMLFLMSAGLTLVFGIMNLINLAHGALYMLGAFIAAAVANASGSFLLGVLVAVPATGLIGAVLEMTLLRHFYARSHLDQVLVTFGLILVSNEVVKLIWGAVPLRFALPPMLDGAVEIFPGVAYPMFRLAILALGLVVAVALYLVIMKTRIGMWVRAGASDRAMAAALGVDVNRVFVLVFAAGSALAGLAGIMAGPILAVQVGMGEPILILALVVTVIGGIGSIKGAFIAALAIGLIDTFGRVLLSPALGSMAIFMAMAVILAWRPKGLFPVHG
ncbi:branched-chain amino acid ABC transporter permease [Phreatobacter stygius]|uniref:Branched-chain amino acid ABC transporter permease n=1 Tax=Phreatobacter stygius TaxID=1940610 RepID=A0A4D7B9N6_9HYPH|nr:branched-chain amino acid ABC transporter permease [Phreatobacter stygius]QCI64742.1 branched-chain amino acid ABC transporter permease [Phreatobacter stygius]